VNSIVVLGSANLDLLVRQARFPGAGETLFGDGLTESPGGKGLNQAVAAARTGGQVIFLGAVGNDRSGHDLKSYLESSGVDVSLVQNFPAPTGTAIVTVTDGGENSIVVLAGANDSATRLDDPSRAAIRTASYLVTQLERPSSLVLEALAIARHAGATTVLTPAPVSRVAPEMFDLVDILILNSGEARSLAGVSNSAEAAAALSTRVKTVVMTRGPRGVVVAREGAIISILPARTVDAIDTTGAGDVFAGVFIARLAGGSPLKEALIAATTAASISVTRSGAATSIPSWAEVAESLPADSSGEDYV
jgi:ribokinase